MCENLPILNLPNEGDDLIFETNASNEQKVRYSKSKKEKNSANIAVKVLIR